MDWSVGEVIVMACAHALRRFVPTRKRRSSFGGEACTEVVKLRALGPAILHKFAWTSVACSSSDELPERPGSGLDVEERL